MAGMPGAHRKYFGNLGRHTLGNTLTDSIIVLALLLPQRLDIGGTL